MNIHRMLLLFGITLALLLAGCGQQAGSESVQSVWLGGSYGLIVSFEDFGVGNEVYEDEAFPIVALLQNNGEFTIQPNEVELKIRGISENDFSGVDFEKTNADELTKVSEYLPDGGYERVSFGDAVY